MTELDSFKYLRTGYVNRARVSDLLVQAFVEVLPGDGVMPLHWKAPRSHQEYLERYPESGKVAWAKSNSSHTLLVEGRPVLRIWTDAKNHCWIDVHDRLGKHYYAVLSDTPVGCARKSRPFKMRVKTNSVDFMKQLALDTKAEWNV